MSAPKLTGRKYDIARLAMWQGFVVCVGAIVAVTLKETSPGVHITSIVGDFALILTIAVSAFNVANATVTSVAAWKNHPTTTVEQSSSTTITGHAPSTEPSP